jgi:hypothetical protein
MKLVTSAVSTKRVRAESKIEMRGQESESYRATLATAKSFQVHELGGITSILLMSSRSRPVSGNQLCLRQIEIAEIRSLKPFYRSGLAQLRVLVH